MDNSGSIAHVQSGEVSADVKFENGKIKLVGSYDGKGSDAEISISVDSDYFLDKLAAKIPGKIDDAILALIKSALKS